MFRVYESRENIPTSDVADSLITGSRLDQEVPWSCLSSDQCCDHDGVVTETLPCHAVSPGDFLI